MGYKVPHVLSVVKLAADSVFYPLAHGAAGLGFATEAHAQYRISQDGKWSQFFVYVTTANTSGDSTFTVRVNGSDTAMAITVSQSATGYFEYNSSEISVSSGDLVSVGVTTTAGSITVLASMGAKFEADSGDSIQFYVMTSESASSMTSSPRYAHLVGGPQPNNYTVEAVSQNKILHACTITSMSCYVRTNTRTSTVTLALRVNASTVNHSISISSSTTGFFTASTTTDAIAVNDLINCISSAGGSGGVAYATIQVTLKSTNPREITLAGATTISFTSGSPNAFYLFAGGTTSAANSAIENKHRMYLNTGGVLSGYNFYLNGNNFSTVVDYTLRVNDIDANQTITVPISTLGAHADTTNSDTITDSDYFTMRHKRPTSGSGSALTHRTNSMLFVMDEIASSGFIPYVRIF